MRTRSRFPGGALALLLAACGGSSNPVGPEPVPTPAAGPPGPVTGSYTLTIQSACPLPGLPVQFAVEATAAGSDRQEVRVTLPGNDARLSLQLLYVASDVVRGAIATQAPVAASRGLYVFFRAIGTGTLTRAADGRGEVTDGVMFGDVSVGVEPGDLDSLGTCTADDHHWSLRAR